MRGSYFSCAAGLLLSLGAASAAADQFQYIRIGDIDGFGWGDAAGLTAANGGPCNLDGLGLLGPLDFLPDVNHDGRTRFSSGDDWDLRSAAETGNHAVAAVGASDFGGTSGSQWNDVTLSISFAGRPAGLPGYVFDFFVADGDIQPGTQFVMHAIYSDYDVRPGTAHYTLNNGSALDVTLTPQPHDHDGWIRDQAVTLNFEDVFSAVKGGYRGHIGMDFLLPNEPYVAFDYIELAAVPEPNALMMAGAGLLALLGRRAVRA